jgi:hypothetical protein
MTRRESILRRRKVLNCGRTFISRRSGFQKYKDKHGRRAAEQRRGCGLVSARPQPRVAAPPCAVSAMADTILMSLSWPENSDQRVIRISTGTERSVLPARLQDFGRVFLFSFPHSHSLRGVSSTRVALMNTRPIQFITVSLLFLFSVTAFSAVIRA